MSLYLITAVGEEIRLRYALSSVVRESLEGEKTLTVSLPREYQKYVSDDVCVRYGNDVYDVTTIRYSEMGQYPVCELDCEHISYRMNTTFGKDANISGTAAVLLSFLLDNTGFTGNAAEISGTYSLHIEGQMYRRNALFLLAARTGTHVIFDGTVVYLVPNHRAEVSENILNDEYISEVAYERNLLDDTTSYDLTFLRRPALALGDRIAIRYTPLGLNVTGKMVIGLEYDPYDPFHVTVEVGDYVPDIVDDYIEQSEKVDEAVKTADKAEKVAEEAKKELEDVVKKSELSASIDTYINEEVGKASIVAALRGTYVESDALDGYTKKTELSAEIGAYIDTQAGTAKIINKLSGTFVKEDALGNYVEKTELSTEIGSYIDTAAGTAKIISAASGTYQKKSDMSGYVTTMNLNTSIGQYIDGSTGKAKIVSACSGTYAKVSAVTSIEQSVSDVESAITLSSSYTKNTIGTNVNALLQLVSNPNSSNIKIKADMIEMTGTTKFLKAADIGSGGSTVIDGGRIQSGKIAAKYIDVDELSASTVYGKGAYSSYIAFTSSGTNLYIGGDALGRNSFSDIFIKSDYVGFGDDGNKLVIDLDSKIIRHNYTSGSHFSIGSNTKPFASLYVDEIYIGGKKLDVSTSSDSSKLTDSIYSYYLQLTNKVLTPSTSGFSLGTTTYPFDTLYVGSSTYYWKITKDSILPNNTSSYYFNIGSATYPVQKLYAKEIYLDGTKITAGGSDSGTDFKGKSVNMGGSTSYYIVANTSRELRPTNSSIYSNYFYLGTASYPWHYAYIGSVATMIGTQSGSKLGFFGTNPVARQSVSNSATVATLISALKQYGLIA